MSLNINFGDHTSLSCLTGDGIVNMVGEVKRAARGSGLCWRGCDLACAEEVMAWAMLERLWCGFYKTSMYAVLLENQNFHLSLCTPDRVL